ncbi:MAG: GNAT family N-acetyltransferase [Chloroflexota bacterium]
MDPAMRYLWRALNEASILLYRAAPGYEARLTPDAMMVLTGEPAADFNCLGIFGGPHPAAQLREFVQVTQSRNLPLLALFAEELSEELAPVARSLGLQQTGNVPLMTYRPRAGGTAASQFQITQVESEEDLRHPLLLASSAFGFPLDIAGRVFTPATLNLPGIKCFVARRNGTPFSSVWTTRGGSTVGIWNMATAPEQQRQGAGRALLTQVIADHVERGAKLFYLLATEAGFPLYQRIGFQTMANPAVWVAGHSVQVGQ